MNLKGPLLSSGGVTYLFTILNRTSLWPELSSLVGSRGLEFLQRLPQTVGPNLRPPSGLVERFHRSLKTSLHAQMAGPDWFDHLPLVMLGLPSIPQ